MGGTPAVKMLREAMVGDEVKSVAGILNGTCNFILSEMEKTGRSFADVLREAQAPGLCRGRSDHGRRRLRRRSQDQHPGRPGLRLRAQLRRRRDRGHRATSSCWTSSWPRTWATASSWWPAPPRATTAFSVKVHPSLAPLEPSAGPGGRGAERPVHRGQADRPDLRAGPGRGRGPDRRRRGRRHRRCDDRRRAPGVPGAGRTLKPFIAGRSGPFRGQGLSADHGRDEPGVIAAISETLAECGVSIDSFLQKPVEGAGGVPIVLLPMRRRIQSAGRD
jgi:homoserine dehydrogenase